MSFMPLIFFLIRRKKENLKQIPNLFCLADMNPPLLSLFYISHSIILQQIKKKQQNLGPTMFMLKTIEDNNYFGKTVQDHWRVIQNSVGPKLTESIDLY